MHDLRLRDVCAAVMKVQLLDGVMPVVMIDGGGVVLGNPTSDNDCARAQQLAQVPRRSHHR
jgi:hypothetical protein